MEMAKRVAGYNPSLAGVPAVGIGGLFTGPQRRRIKHKAGHANAAAMKAELAEAETTPAAPATIRVAYKSGTVRTLKDVKDADAELAKLAANPKVEKAEVVQ
jgi:hypothetical protein